MEVNSVGSGRDDDDSPPPPKTYAVAEIFEYGIR